MWSSRTSRLLLLSVIGMLVLPTAHGWVQELPVGREAPSSSWKKTSMILYADVPASAGFVMMGEPEQPASSTQSSNNAQQRRQERKQKEATTTSTWLEEFSTANGDVINPYHILKVDREADRKTIRNSYVTLAKKYHQDSARNRSILPGKCNNMDDVRDEWEKIKLAYEILSDNRTRRRYDRHEMLADPGAAMRRAAVGAVGNGIKGLGSGIFQVGSSAVQAMVGAAVNKE